MNYTTDQLNQDIRKINEMELEPIRIDRGKRYGDAVDGGDTLANVAAFGWVGGVVSSFECAKRLQNSVKLLIEDGSKNPPDIENACLDGINYLYYTLILLRREHEQD